MFFTYDGSFAPPSVSALSETVENQFWFDRAENQVFFPILLSGAARDSGNSGNTAVLRSGLLLGKITSSGKLVEWSPTATDGSQKIFGILDMSITTERLGNNQDRFIGRVMVKGLLKASRLIVPGQSDFGIASNTNEFLIRAQLHHRGFKFDDVQEGNPFGAWQNIVAKTANYTVTEGDNNVLFTNRGAAGAVIFTLPATAKKGLRFGFYVAADQSVTVTAGTADTLVAFNNAAADSVAVSTASEKIGAFVEVIGDGTGWLTIPHIWDNGTSVTTLTVST